MSIALTSTLMITIVLTSSIMKKSKSGAIGIVGGLNGLGLK